MVSRRRLWHGPVVPGDYRRLLHAVRPHAGLLGLAVASMLVLAAATGAFSWLIGPLFQYVFQGGELKGHGLLDRKSTRLNSSHLVISYAVFCLKKKNS